MKKEFCAIDKESLGVLRHLVDQEFPAVISRFLSDSERYIQQMDAAFKKASYEDLFQLAHTLKGSSGTLSAHQLYEVCAALEQAASNRASLSQLAHLLNTIENEFQLVKEALLNYLATDVHKVVKELALP